MSCALAWVNGKSHSRLRSICTYHSHVCCVCFPPPAMCISLPLKAIFGAKRQNQVRAQARILIERHLGVGQQQQLFPGIPFYSQRAVNDMLANTIPCWFRAAQDLTGYGPLRGADIDANSILHRTLMAAVQVKLVANIDMGSHHLEQGPRQHQERAQRGGATAQKLPMAARG